MGELRYGLGFDVHARDPARPMRLGGVAFAGEPGLAAHSDGDVVCHALCDAILGAAALGDLGQHFPDSDPALEGIEGTELVRRTVSLLTEAGFTPRSCDLVVLADRPRVADRRDDMRREIAAALGVDVDRVSVKATRPEGLGLSGDGAGCVALATVEGPAAR
jgi:2-C-methyl-D-erythritol 2,4-cyclodiphosphate synthase